MYIYNEITEVFTSMSKLTEALHLLSEKLAISTEEIWRIAGKFNQAMIDGLEGKPSPLKMLPSYLRPPQGTETGHYLALDFGGTNVRVLLTELTGNGKIVTLNRLSKPLKSPDGEYDHTSRQATAEQLFDFIASIIRQVVPDEKIYPLGHTFSYPTHQTGLNSGSLIHWTKEIETRHVVGQEITTLLNSALLRFQLDNVRPAVILNDTVGTLLAAAYHNQTVDIGSICGTGHNTAYLEPCSQNGQPMIINMESGNFDELPFSEYDELLNANSEQPLTGRLEKMVSGRYIGEILRLVVCKLMDSGLLAASKDKTKLFVTNLFNGEDVAVFSGDTSSDYQTIADWLENRLHISGSTVEDRYALKTAAALLVTRAARLSAATYIGILRHIDPQLTTFHTIAIDGSLYEKMPGFAQTIETTLSEAYGAKAQKLSAILSKDGSGIGAAIATAIAVGNSAAI
jgi:hexokinase